MARQLGIFFPASRMTPFLRDVASALRERARTLENWKLQLFGNIAPDVLERAARAKLDGAITIGLLEEDAALMEGLKQLGIPAVHAGELHGERAYHEVRSPNAGIGKAAAEHLLDRGLRHFAYVGDRRRSSIARAEGFRQTLKKAGIRHIVIELDFRANSPELDALLLNLPKPAGLMTVHDAIGWDITRTATALGIEIPDQLAVISVGDENPWCTLATPPLSSIVVAGKIIGLEAANMLDDLMDGRPAPMQIDVPAPLVIERESTAIIHGGSLDIAEAARYIRAHFHRPITVLEVADTVGLSRSALERGMKQAIGRTPLQEILRMRFALVRELLAETDLPIKSIALRSGFVKSERLSAAFAQVQGMTPTAYRRQHRGYVPPL